MAQAAQKNTARNHSKPAVTLAKKAEEEVMETGRKAVDGVLHAADNVNHVASECVKTCNGNLTACIESSHVASRLFKQLNGSAMENMNQTFADYMEYSKDALASKDIKDVLGAHTKFVQHRLDRFFDRSEKLLELMFDGYKEVMEPLETQGYNASDQLRKAMAA